MKVLLKDIQLEQLNGQCLILVTRFVRELKTYKGKVLLMQDPKILTKIAQTARLTRNKKLKELYAELKEEIKKSVYESMDEQ